MDEILIIVAPVPGEKQDEKFPGELDVPGEIIRSYDAGAAVAHLHSRDAEHLQTADVSLFKRHVREALASRPVIIEGSTGGAPEHTIDQRSSTFTVPEVQIGSLNMGSCNMFGSVYRNPYSEICEYAKILERRKILPSMCIFDLSHIRSFERLMEEGRIVAPHFFNLIFDVPDALPYRDDYVDLYLSHMPANSFWNLTRHHGQGAASIRRAVEKGGHLRVGYEDGPFLNDGSRAASNAAIVEEAVKLAEECGRKVVQGDAARRLLGLSSIGTRLSDLAG